jgi:hypothetical protein
MATTGIIVEPNMVERVIPGYYHRGDRERIPDRTVSEQKGWIARRGSLQAWSMDRDGAVWMLGFMEGAKR